MGRHDLRAHRVLASANLALQTNRISHPPVWHQIVQDVPPPPRLTRPVKAHRSSSKQFKPARIHYPEDRLRREFFGDHPWELARPRVVLEDSGDDHRGYEWGEGLEQAGKRLDGESVIQRQQYLMSTENMSPAHAYDTARKEFYQHRHLQDIERRIAREEALHTGAYFMPGPNAIAEPLEDAKYEGWKVWAAKRVGNIHNQRMAGYSGSEGRDNDEEGPSALAAEEVLEAGLEEGKDVTTEQTSVDAVAGAVGDGR